MMAKFEVYAQVDTNDGDYVDSVSSATQEDIDRLIPIIEKLDKPNNHNWESDSDAEDIHRDRYPSISVEDIEFLLNFLPNEEYGFHTIECIEYYPMPVKTRLI